jgi:hypothetical protein
MTVKLGWSCIKTALIKLPRASMTMAAFYKEA